MVKKRGQIAKKIQVLCKTVNRERNFALILKTDIQLWPFLCMRNSKLSKQLMGRRGPFATTLGTKGNLSCTTLLIMSLKWFCRQQQLHEH